MLHRRHRLEQQARNSTSFIESPWTWQRVGKTAWAAASKHAPGNRSKKKPLTNGVKKKREACNSFQRRDKIMVNSPMFPVCKAIRLLSFLGGFPGQFVDAECFQFRHSTLGWARLAIVFFLNLPSLSLIHVSLSQHNQTMLDISFNLNRFISMTDTVCYPGLFALNSMLTIGGVFIFYNGIGILNNKLLKFKMLSKFAINEKAQGSQAFYNQMFVMSLMVLNMICSLLGSVGGSIAMFPDFPMTYHWKLLCLIGWTYSSMIGYFSPTSATGYLIARQLLGTANLYQISYREYIRDKYPCLRHRSHNFLLQVTDEESPESLLRTPKPKSSKSIREKIHPVNNEKSHPLSEPYLSTTFEEEIRTTVGYQYMVTKHGEVSPSSLEDDLRLGLDIQYLIGEQDKFFASFFLIESALDLLTESVAIYLSFLMGEALITKDHMTTSQLQVKMLIGAGHFCLFVLAFVRHFGIMILGHRVGSENLNLRKTLRCCLIEVRYEGLTDTEKRLLNLLLDIVSDPAPIHPHKVFALNLSTGLGALGLCLTYVFVLLQFRLSEGQASLHNNSTAGQV